MPFIVMHFKEELFRVAFSYLGLFQTPMINLFLKISSCLLADNHFCKKVISWMFGKVLNRTLIFFLTIVNVIYY